MGTYQLRKLSTPKLRTSTTPTSSVSRCIKVKKTSEFGTWPSTSDITKFYWWLPNGLSTLTSHGTSAIQRRTKVLKMKQYSKKMTYSGRLSVNCYNRTIQVTKVIMLNSSLSSRFGTSRRMRYKTRGR